MIREVIPLTDVVRVLLRECDGLTFAELMDSLRGAGVSLEPSELSSCLAKMVGRQEVTRAQVDRPPRTPGRTKVWRYSWATQ